MSFLLRFGEYSAECQLALCAYTKYMYMNAERTFLQSQLSTNYPQQYCDNAT